MPATPPDDHDTHVQAVQALFLQYQPGIRAFVISMVSDFSLADDVMQEAFLVVIKKAETFELGSNFPAWARSICRFKALETLRKQKKLSIGLSEEVLDALTFEPREFRRDTDERLIYLEECLEKLAPQARRSIDLRYANDHLPTQIAEITGGAIAAVNVTLSRARRFLRECVQERITESSQN
jgi:RNA polymerase sigma-70 factor (ECF subfamily)